VTVIGYFLERVITNHKKLINQNASPVLSGKLAASAENLNSQQQPHVDFGFFYCLFY
jgi:hypothetical protein